MADIHRSRTIAACVGEIWDVLVDFGSISSWADNIDHSCILVASTGVDGEFVGISRRIQVKRETLIERVTEFCPPHVLGYDIEGLPNRLRRVTNRWTLQETGGHSSVVTLASTVEIGPRPPQKLAERVVCRFLARQSDVLLAGLANRLENAHV